ncbi:molecular chaperone [Paenibacillus sp. SYP-B3998]|uniref:Molecular chaperone n=1 Tax=Paenibacillus sp. SYP-B3998 TaxID=2678564 RepID=A0A6G4A677_9BACL|nr:molecular chaperone [Paenibacillus sp. SYP-B3998]NEW09798.1 molecular chaperone [Paenibacillus sp. SYP-B3998]
MKGYTYKLNSPKSMEREERNIATYTRDELSEMTTLQLRSICHKEKLVEGLSGSLDREALMRTVLKYRNAEQSLLITSFKHGGHERVEAHLKRYLNTPIRDNGSLKVPARLTLYSGLQVDSRDKYRIEVPSTFTESNVLIVNDHQELCGIAYLIRDAAESGVYYLGVSKEIPFYQTGNKNYSFLFFRKQDSEYIYKSYQQDKPLPPVNLHYCRIPIADLDIRELEETEVVLAIDFGTSNTTAGAFLDSSYISTPSAHDQLNGRIGLGRINYVSFPNMTRKTEEWIEVLPTVVSVADCSDASKIRYHFGYEALKSMKKSGYTGHATVFHGIKRWVNNYKQTEELMDPQGNALSVVRSDILRAYITHVVEMAEHQFKCRFKHLHISSPVKLRTQFSDMFATILPEYDIETEHGLDEGMAVLYNTIADQIEKRSFMDGESYNALVIDCGGGTTDLSSCRFRIEDGHLSYKLDIHTAYENGDTNYGGNNITYRIMQFMKIVFADYYSSRRRVTDIDHLIDIPGTDLYRHVDEYGVSSVYEGFEAAYREAEKLIPTRFKTYENRTREEYLRVRSNFYFLWEIADNMKKEFFRKTGIVRNRFDSDSGNRQENDLKITAVDRWCLSLTDHDVMKDVYDFPNVVFNIKEINQLIKADIYDIVRKFLEDYYQEGKLQDYSIIKLTGQSCTIDVFREALKEFVAGRSIEFRQKTEHPGQVPDLKLACLRGAIRYLNDRKAGIIEASITNDAPIVPYSVVAFTHSRQEKLLISMQERLSHVQGSVSRPFSAVEVEFYLKGGDGEVRHKYVYTSDASSYTPIRYEDIKEAYGTKIPQDDTDSIINGEVKLFVFAEANAWGFHVLPITRRDEQLYRGTKQFFAFENDLSELDFFDGWK